MKKIKQFVSLNLLFAMCTSVNATINMNKEGTAYGWYNFENLVKSSTVSNKTSLILSDFEIKAGETKEVFIQMTNMEQEITGLQFDIYLPDGISIPMENNKYIIDLGARTTSKKHCLLSASQNDGSIRILAYSVNNSTFAGANGDIIVLTLMADNNIAAEKKQITIKNIILSNTDCDKIKPADANSTATIILADDIETITPTNNTANDEIYTISGIRISEPRKGINIINGKKIYIK